MYLIKCYGPVNLPDVQIVGEYVESFDPDAFDGGGDAKFTRDPAKALRFGTLQAAMEFWRQQSKVRPWRADRKPNRPLTCFHAEFPAYAYTRNELFPEPDPEQPPLPQSKQSASG